MAQFKTKNSKLKIAPFGVIILGAGASSRMGRPKLLLPWRGTTVIGHIIYQWRELGAAQISNLAVEITIIGGRVVYERGRPAVAWSDSADLHTA